MSCANRFCVNLVAHRRQTGPQSGSHTKMAGFPCSGFFIFYLTAITILQVVAAMSVERASPIPLATMPGSNVSLTAAKPPKINPSENGQKQGEEHDASAQGCPNCKNNKKNDDSSDESEIFKQRIEMVKAKILAKLHMDKPPVLKHKPKGGRIAALLENLNLIDKNEEGSETDEPDEDEYYGSQATKIIVFSERAQPPRSRRDFSKNLVFQFKLKRKQLSSSVPSAFLWLHKRKHKLNIALNGKTLHLETHNGDRGVDSGVMTTKVKQEKNESEWVMADVKEIVQHWFNKTSEQYDSSNATDSVIYTIEVSCIDCESEAGHLISSRGRLRPFLVIDLDKPRTLNSRKRRAVTCNGKAVECCRQDLYIDFASIGWDSWILFPKGIQANFCDGSCSAPSVPFPRYHDYHYVIQQVNRPEIMNSVCCAPSKMLSLSIIYFNDEQLVENAHLKDMRVSECSCML